MNQHFVRNKYSPRIGVVVECGEETMTQQHFKDECDINRIARNIEATGSSSHVKQARERYGDFTELFDVGTNMDKAAKAQQLWENGVPPEIKKKVGHSIPEFFNYISKEENFDECVKWGIYDPKPAKPNKMDGPDEIAVPPGSKKDGTPKV